MKKSRFILQATTYFRLPAVLIFFALCSFLNAADYTWTGGGGTSDWGTADNWDNPPVINGSVTANITLNADVTANSLVFNTTSTSEIVINLNGYTLTANSIILVTEDDGVHQSNVTIKGSGSLVTEMFDSSRDVSHIFTLADSAKFYVTQRLYGNLTGTNTLTFSALDTSCELYVPASGVNINYGDSSVKYVNITPRPYGVPVLYTATVDKFTFTPTVTVKKTQNDVFCQPVSFKYRYEIVGSGPSYTINGVSGITADGTGSITVAGTSLTNAFTISTTGGETAGDGVILTVRTPDDSLDLATFRFIQSDVIWNGSVSTDSMNVANWTGITIITELSGKKIVIPSGVPNYPVFSGTGTVDSITILNNAHLTVTGSITVTTLTAEGLGYIDASTGTVTFQGDSSYTAANPGGSKFGSVVIANSSAFVPFSSMTLTGNLTVGTASSFDAQAHNASVSLLPSGTSTITGNGTTSTKFANLSCKNSGGKTLILNGSMAVGTLQLSGTSASRLIVSGNSGTLELSSNQIGGMYLDIQSTVPNISVGTYTAYESIRSGTPSGWNLGSTEYVWLGITSNWNSISNWSRNAVPGIGATVIIPSSCTGAWPKLSSAAVIGAGTITVQTGASLDLAGFALTAGTLDVQGKLRLTGTEDLSGITTLTKGSQIITEYYGTGSTAGWLAKAGSSFQNLTILSGSVITQTAGISVAGDFTNNGTFTQVNDISVAGSYTNNGTIYSTGSGSISLSGTISETGLWSFPGGTIPIITNHSYNDVAITGTVNGPAFPLTIGGNLTVSGVAVFTSPAALTVSGSLTVSNSAVFTTNNILTAGSTTIENTANASFNMAALDQTTTLGSLSLTTSGTISTGNNAGDSFIVSSGDIVFPSTLGTVNTGGSITATAGIIQVEKNINLTVVTTFNSAVELNAAADITFTGNAVFFNTLTGDNAHGLHITGTAQFNDAVTDITNLKVTGTTEINTIEITTTGTQTYGGDVTLEADAVLTGTTVIFNEDIDGNGASDVTAHDLTITGTAVFGDAAEDTINGLDALEVSVNATFISSVNTAVTVEVTGTTDINTTTITTTGTQTYTGNVTLIADTTLTAGSTQNISMGSDLTGGGNTLTISGGNFALTKAAALLVTGLPTLIFSGENAQSFDTGGAQFASVTFNTTNTVTLTDALKVTGTVTVNGAGTIVDFDTNDTGFNQSTGQNFTITEGTVNVGTGQFICGTLDVTTAGTCSFTQTGDNGANTHSAENITGAGTINWDNGDEGGTLGLGESTASAVHYHKKNISITTTPITLSGTFYDLTVPASHILNLGNNITVTNTLTNNGLIVIADYELSFLNYTEGAASAVSIADGIITSTKEAGPSQGFSRVTFTSGSTATIDGDTGGLTIADSTYNGTNLNTNGAVTIPGGTVGSIDIQSGTLTLDGDITVQGNWTNTAGTAALVHNDHSVIIDPSGVSPHIISGDTSFFDLSYTGAGGQTLQIDGALAVTGDLLLSGTDGTHLLTVNGGGSITLSSSQTYGIYLTVDTVPIQDFTYTAAHSTAAGATPAGWNILAGSLEYVWKGGTLTGSIYSWDEAANWETGIVPATDGSVTARIPDVSAGSNTYPSLVTNINLSSLTIVANASLSCEGKNITIGALNNNGILRLNSEEAVIAITTITSNSIVEYYGTGNVSPNWNKPYTNMSVAAGTNLQLGATSINLSGTLTNLGSIEINGSGTIDRSDPNNGIFIYSYDTTEGILPALNGYNFLTVSNGTWTSSAASVKKNLVISGDATKFTSTVGLTVTGLVTVSGTAVFTSDDTLDVTGSLTVSDNAVFTSNNTLTAGATTIEDAANASFNAATLGQTTELDSLVLTTTGNISTGNNAADSVTVNTGDIVFLSTLGTINTGGSITATAGLIQIEKNITLTAVTTFINAVELNAAADITLTGNAVFSNTLTGDATHGLHITGTAQFNDAVTVITTLKVTGTTEINTATITTTGAQTYTGNVTLGANTVLEGSKLTFGAAVIGASHELEINGDADFTGAVSGITTFTINGNTDFTSTVGSITALTINGNAEFNGALTNIGTFYVDGDADINTTINTTTSIEVTGTTDINTSGITTTGTQTYTGDVTLIADTTLTAGSAQDIEMGSGLTGIGTDRTLTISGGNFVLSKAAPVVTNLETLIFTGTLAQSFDPGGAEFASVTFNTTDTVTLLDALSVTDTVTVNGVGTVVDFDTNDTGFSQSTGQNFTITNGTVLAGTGKFICGTLNAAAGTIFTQTGDNGVNIQSAENIIGAGTINWDNGDDGGTLALGGSTASAVDYHYKHVTITSTPIDLSGTFYDLTVPALYTLNLGNNLTVSRNLTNNGSIVIADYELRFLNYFEDTLTCAVGIGDGTITSTRAAGPSQNFSRVTFTNGSTATINGEGGLTIGVTAYNGTGLITTGTVSLPTGTITNLEVQGTTTASGNLRLTGDLTVTGTIDADPGTLTFDGTADQIVNPGTHTIDTIDIAKTGGSISFNTNPLTVTTLSQTTADTFAITFNENLSVTNAVTFSTSGTVTLGDADTDVFTFDGGVSHTAGGTALSGTLQTSDDAIALQNISLGSASAITTGNEVIQINGTITGGGYNLALISGSGTTTVSGNAIGLGDVTLQNAAAAGAVSFNGNFEAAALITFAGPHNISLTGNTTTVTNAVTFDNTGLLTLGNAASDTITFTGGVTHTAGDTTLSGTLRTSDDAITLDNLTLGTNSVIRSLDAAAGAAIAINGNITGAGNNLTLVSGSGTTTVSGDAAGLGIVTLQSDVAGATGTVGFEGGFTATSITTYGRGYDISFTGNSTQVTNAVTFINTGALILGDAYTDEFIFNGGVTHTAGGTTLSGRLQTSDDAVTLQNLTMGTDSEIDSGTAIISIQGSTTGTSHNLTITGDVDFTGAVSGITTFNITGNADFASTVGTVTALTVTGNAEFNGAVTNIGTLEVNGNAVINNTITSTGSIEVTGNTTINTTTITTTGTQTYTGNVTLVTDVTLTTDNLTAQNISMGNDLNGGNNSLIISGGNFALTKVTAPVIANLPTLRFTGANTQSFDPGGAAFNNIIFETANPINITSAFDAAGNITVNNSALILTFTDTAAFEQTDTDALFTITSGTVNVGTGQFICGTLSAALGTSFTQTGNNGLNEQSAEWITDGDGTINWDNGTNGGTLSLGRCESDNIDFHNKEVTISAVTIILSGTFFDLIVPDFCTLTLGTNLTVTNTLTNNGTIAIGNSNYALSFLNYPEDSGSSITIGDGTITSTNDTDLQTVSGVNFTSGSTATINGNTGGLTLADPVYNNTSLVTTGIVSLPTGTGEITNLEVQSGTTTVSGNLTLTGDLTVTGTIDADHGTLTFDGDDVQQVNPGTHTIQNMVIAKNGGSITFITNPLAVTTLSQTTAETFAITFNQNLTVTDAVTFSTSGTVTLGDADTDVFTFDGGVTHTAGGTALSGTLQTSDDAIALQNISLGSASAITTGNEVIQINGTITGAGNDLTLISGTGTAAVSGDAQGLGAVTLQNATAAGTVSFNGIFEAAAITTFGGPHDISFTGDATTVTNAVTFSNTGNLILGDNAADVCTFNGGVTHTAGDTTLSGTLRTSDDAITLDNLTLGSTSIIRSLNAAAGAVIAINGNVTGAGNNLTLISGSGTTTVNGDAAGLGAVTLQSDIAGATGTVSFEGNFEASSIATYTRAYDISFAGNSTEVTNAVTFNNTGNLILGDNAADVCTFNGGVTHTAGDTTLSGRLQTNDDAVTLQNLTIGTDSEISTGNGLIEINGTITGAGNDLTLISGTGTAAVSGDAQGLGAVTLQNATAAGTVSFNGIFEAAAITTFGGPHDISFTGDATTVTNAVTFNNTGNLILGDNAADVCTFNGGVTHTAGDTTLSGRLQTSDDAITLDNLTLGSTSIIRSLDAAAGAVIAINGNVTGAGNNLALVSGNAAATVSGNATNLDTVTLQSDVAGATGTVRFEGNFEAASITTYGRAYDVSFTGSTTTITNAVTFNNTGLVTLGNAGTDTLTFTGGITHTAGNTSLGGALSTVDQPVSFAVLTLTSASGVSTGASPDGNTISVSGNITGANNSLSLTGTTITLSGACADMGNVTITNSGNFLLGNASGITHTANASFTQNGSGPNQLNGSINTSGTAFVSFTSDVYLSGDLSLGGGSESELISTASDLFINLTQDTDTVTFKSSVQARNIALFNGIVNLAGNCKSVYAVQDIVLLNGDTADMYDDPDTTTADVFKYHHLGRTAAAPNNAGNTAAPSLTSFPSAMPDTTAIAHNAVYASSFTAGALNNKILRSDKNFYANGMSFTPSSGTLTLQLANNSSALNAFAEAYNCTFVNTVSNFPVAASENCTDGEGNTNIAFSRPELLLNVSTAGRLDPESGTYTVYDDVIRVEFKDSITDLPVKIENSNNEISKAVKYISTNYGTLPFTEAYTDPECTVSTNGQGDLSFFYIRTNGSAAQRWNTDAAESSAGNDQSTDRGRALEAAVHKTIVPTIDIPKLTGALYASLKDEHKNRITHYSGVDRFISVADRCAPVLIGVYTGQELHSVHDGVSAGSQMPYDSHNFIELVYSEPVDIGGLPSDALNKKVSASFGSASENDWGGSIVNGTSGITVAGYISIENGSVVSGSRNADNSSISLNDLLVHSLYRNFKTVPGEAPEIQTHRIRVSIAGWTAAEPITIRGAPHHFWPGFIDSAVSPSGLVSRISNDYIKDRSAAAADGNIYDGSGTTNHPLPQLTVQTDISSNSLYGPWDVSAPMIAKYLGIEDWLEGSSRKITEILGIDSNGDTKVDGMEMHFFDNTPLFNDTELFKWVSKRGWIGRTDNVNKQNAQDITGGARPFIDGADITADNKTQGGIRAGSLYNSVSGFTYTNKISLYDTSPKSFAPDVFSQDITLTVFFRAAEDPVIAPARDSLYAAFQFLPEDKALFPLRNYYSIQYTPYTGDGTPHAFITDLAGNRMKYQDVETIDRTPPVFSITVGPVGSKELYVVFSKQLLTTPEALSVIPQELELTDTNGTIIDASINQVDSSIPAAVKHDTETGTALIISLINPIRFEDVVHWRLRVKKETWAMDDFTGQYDFIPRIYDSKVEKNSMLAHHAHTLSDFAVNALNVLYAFDSRDAILGQGAYSEGEWAVRDFTGTSGNSGRIYTQKDITIASRIAGLEGEPIPSEKVILYADIAPNPESLAKTYNENTGNSWSIWLPTLFTAFSPEANTTAKPLQEQRDASNAELRNFILPNDPANPECFGWGDGSVVQMMFAYDVLIDHDADEETPPQPLYMFRLSDPSNISSLALWQFRLSDIQRQRGGVTILNNVINVTNRETVVVEVDIKRAGNLTVHVMTLDGNIVKTLQRGRLSEGLYYYKWDGTNIGGNPVARGMYFIRVVGPDIDETRKVMTIK